MPSIWLTNSDKEAIVDKVDYFEVVLFGPYCLVGKGYVRTTGHGGLYLHHIIAKRMGLFGFETIDHENRNPLDNQRGNIRAATYSQNLLNRSLTTLSSSGFRFIVWSEQKKKWQADVRTANLRKHIGFFDSLIEAVSARDEYLKSIKMEIES